MIKMKTARKLLLALMALSLAMLFNLPSTNAAALTFQSVSLTNSAPSGASQYNFTFKVASAAAITEIDLTFSTAATGGTIPPVGFTDTAPTYTPGTIFGNSDTWGALDHATTGVIKLFNQAGSPTSLSAGTQATIAIGALTNPSASACNANGDGVYPTAPIGTQTEVGDTCYVQITTYSAGATLVDTGAATFSLQDAVTASATVDPSITFSVSGIGATVTNAISQTTTVASTYAALPFGHLTAGGSTSIAAQSLTVSTNAQNGFAVTMAMTTQMAGSGTPGNKISPFITGGTPSTWGTPATWVSPSGSAKNGSGTLDTNEASAIGASTTDTNVTGWSGGTNKWGPVPFVQSSAVNVMQSASSANLDIKGVSYQIGVDAYQPADIYSGTVQYFAIPSY